MLTQSSSSFEELEVEMEFESATDVVVVVVDDDDDDGIDEVVYENLALVIVLVFVFARFATNTFGDFSIATAFSTSFSIDKSEQSCDFSFVSVS
jgi:hypothetical protein